MKIRLGFVSNSSSSSFIIKLGDITAVQAYLIEHHGEIAQALPQEAGVYLDARDAWSISKDSERIEGYTCMDNFDMRWFLKAIGVSDDVIDWDN